MRYEELPGPLAGWTYDENGTIHTASGYKTTARQIEFCMWMYACMTAEAKRWMIRSDERPGALRPLFEPRDLQSKAVLREGITVLNGSKKFSNSHAPASAPDQQTSSERPSGTSKITHREPEEP